MEIIKIDKQPSVTEHIDSMTPDGNAVLRFHLQHIKAVREAAGRKMKIEKPHLKYETRVDAIEDGGYIEVIVTLKPQKGAKNEQVQNN